MAKKSNETRASEKGELECVEGPYRVAPGLYKSLLSRLPSNELNPLAVREANPDLGWEIDGLLGDGNLWKVLSPIFGKCDCMEPGRYKKARVFAFETPTYYIWCDNESGDRGNTWSVARKDATPYEPGKAPRWRAYASVKKGDALSNEAGELFERLAIRAALAFEEQFEQLKGASPALRALAEAREIGASAAPAGGRARPKAGL